MKKLKELINYEKAPTAIVGEIEIIKITGKEPECYEYKNINEAAKKHGEEEMLQMFGSDNKITILTLVIEK